MKVLGLAGSPRAWSSLTLKLVEAGVRGAAEAGANVDVIEVAHLNVRRCLGCGECFRAGKCPLDDDLQYLLERVRAADGIILGSPAYAGGVTASVEAIMERLGDVIHCRGLEGKYGFALCVSRGGDGDFVAANIGRFLGACGVTVTGNLGVAAGKPMDAAFEESRALGRDLVAAINEKRTYPRQEESRVAFLREFKENILANKDHWPHDYRYWREKGWV